MLAPTPAPWPVRGATFVLWALAAASAAYWGLKLGGTGAGVRAPLPPARQLAAVDPAAIARLLGSEPGAAAPVAAAPSLASRFQLLGVVAGVHSGAGAAVISVDGKPARSFRVGSMIDEGLVLQSVHGRQATLGTGRKGPPVLTLELPRAGAPGVTAPPQLGPVIAPALPQAGAAIAPPPSVFAVPPQPPGAVAPPQAAATAAPK